MIFAWWWLWMVFLFAFLLAPTGYGWGHRGWGPPYPRYLQRRRAARAAARGDAGSFDHHAWGMGGDLLWLMFTLWVVWYLVVTW